MLPRASTIRHYGLFANANRAEAIARARALLGVTLPPPKPEPELQSGEARVLASPCPCCGARMHVIETFEAGTMPRHRPSPKPITIRIDTS